ncbi:MAG: NAD-binding protein [Acidimicrobiia bacterium]
MSDLLASAGHTVARIESVPGGFAVKRNGSGNGETFPGLDPECMTAANASSADLMVAAAADDNLNIVAMLLSARVMGPRRTIAVVADPARAATYAALGMVHLRPETAAGQAILAQIEGLRSSLDA